VVSRIRTSNHPNRPDRIAAIPRKALIATDPMSALRNALFTDAGCDISWLMTRVPVPGSSAVDLSLTLEATFRSSRNVQIVCVLAHSAETPPASASVKHVTGGRSAANVRGAMTSGQQLADGLRIVQQVLRAAVEVAKRRGRVDAQHAIDRREEIL